MWFRAMIKYFKYFSLHPFKKSISKPSDLCFSLLSSSDLIKCAHPHFPSSWDTVVNGWWMAHRSSGSRHSSNLLHSINSFLRPEKQGLPALKKKKRPWENTQTQLPHIWCGQTPGWEKWRQNTHQGPFSTESSYVSCPKAPRVKIVSLSFESFILFGIAYSSWSSVVPRKAWWQFIPV